MTRSEKKVAVFGCKQTTRFFIEFLTDELCEIDRLITIAPDLAKKNAVADYDDLTGFAAQRGIPAYQARTYSLSDPGDQSVISDFGIDIAFVIGWQRLIPHAVLDSIVVGCFGMHGSSMNLPLGRGRSPMNWALIEGRHVFYTNLFKYDPGVDSGDILDSYKFSITERDNAETLHFKNTLAMRHLVAENFTAMCDNSFKLRKQPAIEPTYYPKRTPADSLIDWTADAYRIDRHIKAVAPPFGGAFTFIDDERLTIYEAQVFDVVDFGYEASPVGTIVEIFNEKQLLVRAIGGLILIKSFTCSKNPVKGDVFHNNDIKAREFPTNAFGNFDVPLT